MNLNLNIKLAKNYNNKSQIIRVLSENWVLENSYCPACGDFTLFEFENNRPVADVYCKDCLEEFELKSNKLKNESKMPNKILDGAYSSMISRINSDNNPNFFFLTYNNNWRISNFLLIPKQFFSNEIIIKRKPLSVNARRAGWIGCYIDITNIPESGKIFLVKNSKVINKSIVKESFNKTKFIRNISTNKKGWLFDIMKCLDKINSNIFTLNEIYSFERELKIKYPKNNFIKDKIRQQMQVLRDKGLVEFVGRGKYKKVNYGNI